MKKQSITALLLLGLVACSNDKSSSEHFNTARELIGKQQYADSVIELKNAIRLAPQNSEYRIALGRVYLSLGNNVGAQKEFEKALTLDSKNAKILVNLASSYHLDDKNDEIIGLKGDIERFANPEQKIEYKAYQVAALIRLKQTESASKLVEELNAEAPGNIYVMFANAFFESAKGELDVGLNRIEKVLEIDSGFDGARLLKAQVLELSGNLEDAVKEYKDYLADRPQAQVILLKLASTLIRTPNYKDGEIYADKILKDYPKQPFATYVKAVVKFLDKDYENAYALAETSVAGGFSSPHLNLITGMSAFELENYEVANHYLSSIERFLVKNHPAKRALIVSQLKLGQVDKLIGNLKEMPLETKEDTRFLTSLSLGLFNIGAEKEARELISRANEGASAEDKIGQSALQLLMNKDITAENVNAIAEQSKEHPEAKLILVLQELRNGNFEVAQSQAESWVSANPDSVAGLNVLAMSYLKQRKLAQAEDTLLATLKKDNKSLFAHLELIKVYLTLGRKQEAKNYINAALKLFPDSVKVLELDYMSSPDDLVFERIKSNYQRNKLSADSTILMSKVYLARQNYDEAYAILANYDKDLNTPKLIWRLWLSAAQQLKKSIEIPNILQTWLKVNPYHVEPVLFLTGNYYRKEPLKALQVLNNALKSHHENNQILKLAKVNLLLDLGKEQEARNFYERERSVFANDIINTGIEGRLALLANDYELASDKLGTFYNRYPSAKNVLLLAFALDKGDKREEAITVLESFAENQPDSAQVNNLLANLYLTVDKRKALEQYKKLVEEQPNNAVALNNLAWLSKEEGEFTNALQYSNKAFEISPKIAQIVDTRAMINHALGNLREALTDSTKAYELSEGNNIEIALNYAEVLIANNRKNKAKSILSNIKTVSDIYRDRFVELNLATR